MSLLASLTSQTKPHGTDPRNGREVVWYRVVSIDDRETPLVEGLCYVDEVDATVRSQIELLVLPQAPGSVVTMSRVALS